MGQLAHLRVLELASVLAGPSVGQFFAELGADVIKVENVRAGGDVTRTWKLATEKTDDRSAYFCSVNWGKKSIAVDLNTTQGRLIVQRLAGVSDIVLVSYKPGDAEKLGVDFETLSRSNDKLIYGSITGYGAHNPDVGYDAIIQAEAGFMLLNGEPGRSSLKMPVALMDVLAGHQLKEGLLLALMERMISGKGKKVEVSLIQSGVASLVNQATNYLIAGKTPAKQGSIHPNIAPYGDMFTTADGKELILAVGNDRQFEDLCFLLGIPDVSSDERFKTNSSRVLHRAELQDALRERISLQRSDEFARELKEKKIPGGLLNDLRQVFEMKEAKELLMEQDGLKGVRSFVAINDQKSDLSSPPKLGEHTDQILRDILHMGDGDIEQLRGEKVVG